jgi:heterodisulfide reductase subunit B
MTYAYFPGCSLRGTGKAYEESLLAVFQTLGVDVQELPDWNCCGATTYMSFDELQSYALAGRNLAIAGRAGQDIVAPCAACYLVLNKTHHYVHDYPHIRYIVDKSLASIGLEYHENVRILHPLEILLNEVGLAKLKAAVKNPLSNLRVAPYYGCQIVRPYATFDTQRDPTSMDKLIEACGAKVVYYPVKTVCCGGSQKGSLPEIGLDLIRHLLRTANANGGNVIATACPLCQFNLEVFQKESAWSENCAAIPILYFTQLIGLALGIDRRTLGLHRSLVPLEALEKEVHAHV